MRRCDQEIERPRSLELECDSKRRLMSECAHNHDTCQCNALASQVEEIMESPLGSSLCAREEERLAGLRGFLLYPD